MTEVQLEQILPDTIKKRTAAQYQGSPANGQTVYVHVPRGYPVSEIQHDPEVRYFEEDTSIARARDGFPRVLKARIFNDEQTLTKWRAITEGFLGQEGANEALAFVRETIAKREEDFKAATATKSASAATATVPVSGATATAARPAPIA
jgi:hypothetical protein